MRRLESEGPVRAKGATVATTKGRQGNVAGLKTFEDLAVRHEARLLTLKNLADTYIADLKSGKVQLDPDALKGRGDGELRQFRDFLSPDAAKLYLAREGYDAAYGARPLKRTIQRALLDPLSLEILAGKFSEGDNILVDAKKGKLTFDKQSG